MYGPPSTSGPLTPEGLAVLLVTPWYGGARGGVAVSCETLAGAMAQAGVSVIVLTLEDGAPYAGRFGEAVRPIVSYGADVARSGLKGWLGYWRRALASGLALATLARRHPTLVVHFQFCVPAYRPLRIWCRLLRLPVVVTFRGSDINQLDADSVAEGEVAAMIDDADAVTAVSEGLLDTVHDRFPAARAKSCVVRNVVPLDVWRDAVGPGAGAPAAGALPGAPRDIDVLFLGNLLPVKGPDQLLAAVEQLVRQRPTTSVCFVGSGELEPELRAAVGRAGLERQVTFAGRVGRAEVAGWLRRARVLALPSRSEGLPLSAIEAQLLGVPVVAFAVGGVPQAVADGETGLLVPPGDIPAFAAALQRLLADERVRGEYAARAASRARRLFDPDRVVRTYAQLYTRLLADGPRRRRVPDVAAADDLVPGRGRG